MTQTIVRKRTRWQLFARYLRRNRELIMIVLTIIMSLAFLAFGFIYAYKLESANPQWFQGGF
jgi:hypothetical protein